VTFKTSEQAPEGGPAGGGAEGSLGEQLRRARLERGVNLREVAEQTRITMRHLEAIEADDYKALPGGIFNKSFIKSYARHVGFPEARALELYERTSRARGFQDEEPPTSPQRSHIYMGETARSPLMTYGLSAVIVGILILLVYAGLHYYRRTEAQGPAAAAAATPTPAAAAVNQQAPAATPTAPPAEGAFKVQLKAARAFWLTSWQEGEKKKRGRFLKPDAPEEIEPAAPLNLHYDQVSADALQVTVNGRPLKTPTDTTVWTITRDNYTQFAQ
jgi:cytoskeletal protein RodZ